MSGFKKFLEAEEQQPNYVANMGDELGVDPEDIEKFYSNEITTLADIKLPDGTYHSLLPVRVKPGSMTDTHVTIVIDDTFSPNLNDKVLRKMGKKMVKVPYEREPKEFTISLADFKKHKGKGKGITFNDLISQGWTPAIQQQAAGGMGAPPGGMI
jgi:hypothetical protein